MWQTDRQTDGQHHRVKPRICERVFSNQQQGRYIDVLGSRMNHRDRPDSTVKRLFCLTLHDICEHIWMCFSRDVVLTHMLLLYHVTNRRSRKGSSSLVWCLRAVLFTRLLTDFQPFFYSCRLPSVVLMMHTLAYTLWFKKTRQLWRTITTIQFSRF